MFACISFGSMFVSVLVPVALLVAGLILCSRCLERSKK